MSDHFTAEQARQSVATAQQALAAGDLAHALFHITSALGTDPTSAGWLKVMDEVLRRADDPLVLARMDDTKPDFITAAARSYVLASKGRFAEAIPLVVEVAAARPDVPFLIWGATWMRCQGVAPSLPYELVEGSIVPPMLGFATRAPSPMDADDPRRKSFEAAADMLSVLAHYHPQRAMLPFAMSVVLRRLGRFDDAVARATYAHQLDPKWNTVIGVACAHRDAGHVDEAVRAYTHALSLDPNEVSAHLDIGDTYLDAGRFDEAIAAYEAMLAREPGHTWAAPSALYARFKKTGDPADKAALFRLTDESSRAWRLFCELQPIDEYVHLLPGPADATASALRDVMAQLKESPGTAGGNVAIKVTHPESPSVLTAFRLWTEREQLPAGVTLEVEKVQTPDPRVPKAKVDFALWAYDDTRPRPAVPAPDPRASAAIAAIAREPFHLALWDAPAAALAAQMGPAWLQQILCVMVHPPALPPKLDPYDWVRRVQIAAALVVGHLDTGWGEGSIRFGALRSLALGPVDWTVDAAIIVMAWLARGDAAVRTSVEQLFGWMESQTARGAYTCFERPLAGAWLSMGGHDAAVQKRLEAWIERIDSGENEAK